MASIREQIRDQFSILLNEKQFMDEVGVDVRKQQLLIRPMREKIAELQARLSDPLAKPMTFDWRHCYRHEGEAGYDYVIIPDDGSTDDELSEWFDSCVAYPPINSPYDCTGKRFTDWKHIHRVPAGIVVIHGWSLDI